MMNFMEPVNGQKNKIKKLMLELTIQGLYQLGIRLQLLLQFLCPFLIRKSWTEISISKMVECKFLSMTRILLDIKMNIHAGENIRSQYLSSLIDVHGTTLAYENYDLGQKKHERIYKPYYSQDMLYLGISTWGSSRVFHLTSVTVSQLVYTNKINLLLLTHLNPN